MTRRAAPLMGSPGWGTATVLVLYAWQGIVAGFALTALPNHMAALGATVGQVGTHVATVGLPWILQPLWGPVVDRFGGLAMGRRRGWVILATFGSVLALSRLLLIGEATVEDFAAISAVFLVQSAFAALADTATDAMIIDNLPGERLGTVNAVTRVGFVGGAAAGTAVFAWMLPAHGLHASTVLLVAVGTVVLLVPLLVREGAADALLSLRAASGRAAGETLPRLLRRLGEGMRDGRTVALLALCFATDFASAAFRLPLGVDLIQARGWTAEGLSNFQALAALIAGTLGALAVGWWADRVGTARALAALLLVCAVAHAGAGVLLTIAEPRGAAWASPAALGLSMVVPTLLFVALAPAVMRASFGALAATRFALFMAALNLGDVAGSAAASALTAAMGLPALGVIAGVTFLIFAACVCVPAGRRLLIPPS